MGSHDGPPDLAERLDRARAHIEELLPGAVAEAGQAVFLLYTATGIRERFLELQRRLVPLGLLPLLRSRHSRPALILIPRPPAGRWAWQTNALLFLATVVTTYVSGYLQSAGLVERGLLQSAIAGGFTYAASLLFILGAHEMGHKLVAVRRGIDASLPYFLPMLPLPPLPGTMGAVIVTRTPAPNRDSLMDLGASGPIAGFVAAILVLIYGISRSFVIAPGQFEGLGVVPDPLLTRGLVRLILNPPPGTDVLMHPVMYAGWIGLLVTSINLLPAGMLDGGHAVRAALGARWHMLLSYAGVVLAVLMQAYLMAVLIALLMRRGHVGPLDDLTPMSPSRRLIGLSLVAIFVLSTVVFPVNPFR
ncbi:MAG: site-2 protease family protein [Armatimonadota bacterium]